MTINIKILKISSKKVGIRKNIITKSGKTHKIYKAIQKNFFSSGDLQVIFTSLQIYTHYYLFLSMQGPELLGTLCCLSRTLENIVALRIRVPDASHDIGCCWSGKGAELGGIEGTTMSL